MRGAGHAPGGIDSRSHLKRHLARVRRFALRESRHIEQRPQARIAYPIQPRQASFHDHPILAGERHHVGHRRDRHQFQQRIDQALAAALLPAEIPNQRIHQLQRHTGSAQILLRIAAIGTIGIQHGHRRRKLGFGQVVIGHDHVDPQPRGVLDHLVGANPRVHADDERDAGRGGVFHHFAPHAIAVF